MPISISGSSPVLLIKIGICKYFTIQSPGAGVAAWCSAVRFA